MLQYVTVFPIMLQMLSIMLQGPIYRVADDLFAVKPIGVPLG